MGRPSLRVNVLLTGLLHMKVMKALNDRIRIDLGRFSAHGSQWMIEIERFAP